MVHVVFDTKGAGRIVGVFSELDRAERICAIDPPYFRLMSIYQDAVNPVAIEWLSTPEKQHQLADA